MTEIKCEKSTLEESTNNNNKNKKIENKYQITKYTVI